MLKIIKKEILKVSRNSNPNSVAGAIAEIMKKEDKVELQAIGAAALNQAVKAIAISRGFLAPLGIDLICIPVFKELFINSENITAIKFILKNNN